MNERIVNSTVCVCVCMWFRCDSDRARWLGALEEAISRNERRRSTLQLEAELPEVPMIKDPHIKSAVESMSVSPTLTRHKSLRRKFSMRRKAMQKVRWDAEETDSGNASDISTEFYLPGKAGDRTSKDLDVSWLRLAILQCMQCSLVVRGCY